MNPVSYVTVDVFTETRFAGNPLAVIPDARGLSDEAMQAIATEFNYSEVTFVLPPEDPANTAGVRIFTPTAEVPFAGHPNVGTAYVLGRQPEIFGRASGDTLRFEERAGLVEVSLIRDGGEVVGATIRAPRPLELGDTVTAETIAACASIDPAKVVTTRHAPIIASVGLAFAVAELDSLEALAAARPNVSVFADAASLHPRSGGDFSLFLYVRPVERPWSLRARMFAPLDNVIEDPATGSASAALAAYLATLAPEQNTDIHITIEQGVEMGRRSVIELDVNKQDGIITKVDISGRCVGVMRGSLSL
ncbi:PhzF family phenazine biosynthesis protein [Rhizobiaceae bacterium n13]|uniref:PhzF family phenazine biosynthesis protein n=1 Tax=Ferirhizobium litorale TaxID=2927786 RepID=A0AAE3TZ74_9HYPH|nr:PhzF family phenazine biosynthesis protein [Fererhizobium litorale]MDI7860559.1 PhzF family phenazine biosynthesis protein [Fererhizobium litorale]MDI7920694.1 PhzF family phenazine biosynthesis protein [Fererhizobium litorale]